jgi:hypothetical protein
LNFLDKDSPDKLRFSVLKQIFLVAATEQLSDRTSFLPRQFMGIARRLSDGEILILNACYRAYKDEGDVSWQSEQHPSAHVWLSKIATTSHLNHSELIELYEETLIEKKLLTPRQHSDRSGVSLKPYYRLTSLGLAFCEFVNAYRDGA